MALLVSPADLTALLACNGDWLKALPQARRVVAASVTGEALFSFVLSLVSTDSLQEVMDLALAALEPHAATKQMINGIREQLADDLDEFAEGTTLPKQRYVDVKFLGQTLSVRVSGLDFELELRIAAAVKTAALTRAASLLPRMPHESWVMPEPSAEPFTTEAFIMGQFRSARAYAMDIFKARPPSCVGDVQKILGAASMDLLRLDPTYCLEIAYAEQKLSKDVAKAVEVAILRILPSASRSVTLAEAEVALDSLATSEMLNVADRSSQSQLEAVKEGLSQVRKSLAPSYELWANDAFFKQCLTSFGHFCRVPVGQYGNEGDKELVSKEAMQVKMAWVRKHVDNAELVTYAVLDDFFRYPWLLSAGDQKDVKSFVERVMARSQASSSTSGAKSAKRSKSQGVKKEAAPASCAKFF